MQLNNFSMDENVFAEYPQHTVNEEIRKSTFWLKIERKKNLVTLSILGKIATDDILIFFFLLLLLFLFSP